MNTIGSATDHRALMQRVEEVIDHIEEHAGDGLDIPAVATEVIRRLRDELGIYGGRLYESDGDYYVLRATFPDAKEIEHEIRVPRTYPPLELCLMRGSVYMTGDDPRVDPELEAELGVKEFAAVEIGNEQYVLGFNVAPGHDQSDILFSLGVVRHSLNRRIHQERLADMFRQARQIQTSILPRSAPRFSRFDIAGRSHSMESVGGDLFDFIPITDKILGVAIADASGHGLPAALHVRDIYTGLRMGLGRDFKIVRTVERLNNIIHTSTLSNRFVSLFYGELERNGAFIGVNAGHPPPFHLSAGGAVAFLDQGGPVLGPLPDVTYDRSFVQMRPGDVIVLYTDGITETLGGSEVADEKTEYGIDRLLQVVRQHQGSASEAVLDAIFADLTAWSGGAPARDDSTAVVVSYPKP